MIAWEENHASKCKSDRVAATPTPPGVSHPSRRTSRRPHTVQPTNLPAPAVILQASHSLPCSLQLHWPPCAARMFQALSKLGLTALAAPPAPDSHGCPLTSHSVQSLTVWVSTSLPTPLEHDTPSPPALPNPITPHLCSTRLQSIYPTIWQPEDFNHH